MSKKINYNFSYFYYNRFMDNTKFNDINPYTSIEKYFKENVLSLVPMNLSEDIFNLKFSVEVLYPGLLIGIGNTNLNIKQSLNKDKKNKIKEITYLGFTLDYVTGMPYIPGSAIKGLFWSVFREKQLFVEKWLIDAGLCGNKIPSEIVKKLKNYLFGYSRDVAENNSAENIDTINSHYCKNVYYDAVIIKPKVGFLDQDNICPHKYNESGELEKKPIFFLRITPGTEFEFRFKINNKIAKDMQSDIEITPELLTELFKNIIRTFGIGAKTNVGYGRME